MSALAIVIALAALLMSVLAAAVTAVVRAVDALRALELADEEVGGAEALLWLVERPILTHRVSGGSAVVAALALAGTLPFPGPLAPLAAFAVVLVVAPLLGIGLVSRGGGASAERAGLRLAPLARPVVRLLGRPLERMSPSAARDDDDESGDDEDEDDDVDVDGSSESTVLDAGERRMILSILELDDTTAREIMVPRPDVITVAADASFASVLDAALDNGRSRLPVHDPHDPDEILGVVHARDLFARLRRDPTAATATSQGWADLIRDPYHVPESKPADDLLRDLQAAAVHLALVVDEYGVVVGIVTIEDVLEEIVGEIVDEHDDERPAIEPLGEGRWRVDGGANVYDLGETLDVELPDEAWDTVGGLVIGTLGRLPRVGDRVRVDGLELTVTVRRGRRIAELLVERVVEAPAPA
jgi:putative hemolysin